MGKVLGDELCVAIERLLKLATLHRTQHHIQRVVLVKPHTVFRLVPTLFETPYGQGVQSRLQKLGTVVQNGSETQSKLTISVRVRQ